MASTPRSRFLARLQPGAKCAFRADWCPEWTTRTVTRRQTRRVAFTHPTREGTDSWLDFPTADEVAEPAPGHFIIDGRLEYRFNP